jgi:type I restriction enzyme, S subunit
MTFTPIGWKVHRLDELGFVGRGRSRHRPRNDPSLYGGSYPFVQTADIKAANLRLREFTQTYNEAGLAQSKMWAPGTLCITIAANIAETAILAISACFPDSVIGFIADPKKADTVFIKHYIDFIKLQMQQVSHGTTQDNLSLDKLLRFDFVVPEAPVQRKIATILFAYDDLIENNLRRIKILEEMAQTLYREWFVKFRFPGHQKVKMVDSPLGKIPEGWQATKVFDVANIFRGRSYKGEHLVDEGGLPFINLKCIDRDGGFRIYGLKCYLGPFNTSQTAKCGDIVIAITDMTQERRIVARAARIPRINTDFAVFSMDLVKIKTRDETPPEYLYGVFRYSVFPDEVKQYANGVNVLHLNPDHIGNFIFPLPPADLYMRYSEFVKEVYAQIDVMELRNNNLRQTRDLLLPKLISGELDVSELDITIPEANA